MARARKRRTAPETEQHHWHELPESKRHLELRTLLYDVLVGAFGHDVTIGSKQLVYWGRGGVDQYLVPDLFVQTWDLVYLFQEWDAWKRGIPQLAVEILETGDRETVWPEKLERYGDLRVDELVCFDPDSKERPIRIWNSIEGSRLFERKDNDIRAPSWTLPGVWVTHPDPKLGLTLRLLRTPECRELWPTSAERIRALEAELKARG